MPPKFITAGNKDRINGTHVSEDAAVLAASKAAQPDRLGGYYGGDYEQVGIYRLIKVVRRKVTPIEVEETACCGPVTGE